MALHGLPENSDVPWYCVIDSQGRISTGLQEQSDNLQRILLEAEGIEVDERGCADWDCFGWAGLLWPEVEELIVWDIEHWLN